ncbi:MAG: cytochrome P450 [Gammaproteobacteria bacterium]
MTPPRYAIAMTPDLDTLDIHRTDTYATHGFPWAAWDRLRREAPVHWYERDDIEPFWAVTRHADILTVSAHPQIFVNGGPRLRMAMKGQPEIARAGLDEFGRERGWDADEPPDMVFTDNPRHRRLRKLTSWAYTRGAMRAMQAHFEQLAARFTRDFMQRLRAADGAPVDFVHALAARLPLVATAEILGLDEREHERILLWGDAMVGEVAAADRLPGESRGRAAYRLMYELRQFFEDLIEEARAHGRERGGLIDHMVRTPVGGQLLTNQQLNGYLFLLFGAGNDTTRNAFSGGVAALMAHPEQRERLRADPSLLPLAVEEILRWTSPVGSFLRTATEDFVLAGSRIRAGDTVALFYPSANRDESVFDAPYCFDVGRSPNPHLTFGFGAHFCLGTNLARAELRASLAALLPHLADIEPAGTPTYIRQTHVLGYAHMPVRLAAGAPRA